MWNSTRYDHCPRCFNSWNYPYEIRDVETSYFKEIHHLYILKCSKCEFKVFGCGKAHSREPWENLKKSLDHIFYWQDRHKGYSLEEFDHAVNHHKLGE